MRYYFHLVESEREADHDGVELPDDDAAKAEAVTYVGQLLQNNPMDLWKHKQWRVEVTDEAGTLRWMVLSVAVDGPAPDEHLDAFSRKISGDI